MRKIQVLGTGCAKCNKLTAQAQNAIDELGNGYLLEKITDLDEILEFGVMATPSLVIDGEIKASGKVLSSDQIKKYLIN